jgi:hypothetical protein
MRASRKDCDDLVRQIEVRALVLGLLPAGGRLSYHPGNTTQGYAPQVEAYTNHNHEYRPIHVDFLPEFTYRTTRTAAYAQLAATNRALAALERI